MSNVLVESDRLLVRCPEEGDCRTFERVFCDPAMMRYLGGVWTPGKVAEALQEWRQNWGVANRWYGTLLRKDSLEPIGTAGFTENTIPDELGLELSWFVLPEHQSLGFATEITSELLRFAFVDLGAKRMVAETHPENPASSRVLEKLCFEYLGERQHQYDYLPGFETQALWALTRENWRQGATP
jgi:[ribosomal protein S5]-alanine N-acetyltransferase